MTDNGIWRSGSLSERLAISRDTPASCAALGISMRTQRALEANGLHTVGEVDCIIAGDDGIGGLLRLPKIGRKAVEELVTIDRTRIPRRYHNDAPAWVKNLFHVDRAALEPFLDLLSEEFPLCLRSKEREILEGALFGDMKRWRGVPEYRSPLVVITMRRLIAIMLQHGTEGGVTPADRVREKALRPEASGKP